MKPLLIEPQYFPPVAYFAACNNHKLIVIDDLERYGKQSFRNRALISTANKVLPIIVPLEQGKTHLPMKDVKINYSENWQKIHLTSIVSAYNKSAYFEFYRHLFEDILGEKHTFLLDLDMHILNVMKKALKLDFEIKLLSEVQGFAPDDAIDLRSVIHPKKKLPSVFSGVSSANYIQVFSDRFGFIPNLSVIDLLSNVGPGAKSVLGYQEFK